MSVISHNGNDEFEFEFESDSDEDIVISMLSNTLNAPVKKTIPAPVRTSPAPPRSWLTERLLSEDTQVNLNGRRPSKTDFSMDQTRQFSHFNAQRSASPALGISTKINPKETPIGGSNPIPIRSPRFSTNSLLPPQKDYGSLPNDPNPFPVVNQDSFRPEVPIRSNSMRPTYGIHNLNRLQDHRPSLGNNQRRRPSFSRQYNNVRIDRNNFEPHSNTSSPLRVSTSVTDYSNDYGNRISANASESDGITKTRRSSKLHILSDDEDDDVKSGISQTVSTNLQSRGSYQVRFDTPQPSSLNGSLYSNLDAIEEEPSNSDVRRSRTWHGSVTSHIVPSRSTSLIDIPNTLDTCVYSAYLYKSNRSGKFQRRLVRFDGTLFICMSSSKDTIRTKQTILDFDLLESPHPMISSTLSRYIRDFYPAGSALTSLANMLISSGSDHTPDLKSNKYFVPKWIVSSDSIIEVETNVNKNHPESASSRTFTIVTKTDRYKFQASTSQEVQRWKFLLQSKLKMKSLVSNYSENTLLESDSAQVSLNQQNSLYQFIRVQLQWKKALMAVLSKNERARFNITTIQIAPDGVHILYGTVRFYKEEAHTEGNTNLNKLHILGGDSELPKTITSPAKSRFSVDRSKRRGSGSHFIDDQIAELDREIIATKPTSFF